MEQGKKEALDKVIILLQEFAGKVGETAEAIWPHAVSHFRWEAISLIILGLGIGAAMLIFSWRLSVLAKTSESWGKDDKDTARVFSIIVAMIGLIAFALLFSFNMADAVEPTGGLLRQILQ